MNKVEDKWYFNILVVLAGLMLATKWCWMKFATLTGFVSERKTDVVDEMINSTGIAGNNPMIPATIGNNGLFVAILHRLNEMLHSTGESTQTAQRLSLVAIFISAIALLQTCTTPSYIKEQHEQQLMQNKLLEQINDKLTADPDSMRLTQ